MQNLKFMSTLQHFFRPFKITNRKSKTTFLIPKNGRLSYKTFKIRFYKVHQFGKTSLIFAQCVPMGTYVYAVEFVTALGWKWLVVDKIPFEFDKKEGNCLVFRPGYQYSLVKSLAKFGQKKRWKMRMMRLFSRKKFY